MEVVIAQQNGYWNQVVTNSTTLIVTAQKNLVTSLDVLLKLHTYRITALMRLGNYQDAHVAFEGIAAMLEKGCKLKGRFSAQSDTKMMMNDFPIVAAFSLTYPLRLLRVQLQHYFGNTQRSIELAVQLRSSVELQIRALNGIPAATDSPRSPRLELDKDSSLSLLELQKKNQEITILLVNYYVHLRDGETALALLQSFMASSLDDELIKFFRFKLLLQVRVL